MMLDLPGEDQRDIRGMWWLRFGSIWGKDRSINCDVLKRSVVSNYYGYWGPPTLHARMLQRRLRLRMLYDGKSEARSSWVQTCRRFCRMSLQHSSPKPVISQTPIFADAGSGHGLWLDP